MKSKSIILIGAAMIMALTACESKNDVAKDAYVSLESSAVSVAEDAGTLSLNVQAYSSDNNPQVTVTFGVTDGTGDNGAKNGTDYWIESPENNTLTFNGTTTQSITIGISDANVGTYTGPKQFTVTILTVSNDYSLGANYSTTVTITDVDKEQTEGAPDVVGYYTASGIGREMSGFDFDENYNFIITYEPTEKEWNFTVFQDEDDPEIYFISGLVEYVADYYLYNDYNTYFATAYLSDDGYQLIVPAQTIEIMDDDAWEDSVTRSVSYYYDAYIPCTGYDAETGEFYYGSTFDNITFTYKPEDGTWVSDYGIAYVGCDSNNIATYNTLYDVSAPGLVITKKDD